MKARLLFVFVIVIAATLAVTWAVAAQQSQPPMSLYSIEQHGVSSSHQAVTPDWTDEKPVRHPTYFRPNTATAADSVGLPGTSFRYVQTFGITEQPYLADTLHLNYPWGLGTDGTNVWIGERNGLRALKYSSTGQFLAQIGRSGVHDDPAISTFGNINDVAVDSSGNVWLADAANHVIKFDASTQYVSELGQTWNYGTDNNHFGEPASIAFDGAGNVYVSDGAPLWTSDYGNHRIQIFDSAGTYLNTIGTSDTAGSGNLQFHGPRHITIFANRLYVADSANHRVQIIDVSVPLAPSYVATLGTSGMSGNDNSHLNNPSGVAADSNFVYVADTWNNRVQIFNRSTYTYVGTIGTGEWGSGNTQFKNPSDVAVDTAGNLYVVDYDNSRVQQFNSGRTYVRTYGVTGVPYVTDGYHYNDPRGVAVATDGSVYIAEESGQRLIKVNSAGAPQWIIGVPGVVGGWDGDNTYFNYPNDLALDAAGRVYVADLWNHRIQIFDPAGAYVSTLGTPGTTGTGNNQFNAPRGLAIAPNGYLYVADTDNQRVQIFDGNRNYVATLGTTGVAGADNGHFQNPEDVVVDGQGLIYVADSGNLRVQVFNANRTYLRTLGVTGVSGNDFSLFNGPYRLAVDAQNNLYAADGWNCRVQVFDQTGAYLTTIGGSCNNSRAGQVHGAFSVALDRDGAVYLGDAWNFHRVQKFVRGVPGWAQININGFGDRTNLYVSALNDFGGQLYAGTYNWSGNGAQVWRTSDGTSWTPVMTNGFGITRNVGIDHLFAFNGQMYAGTWADEVNGGEVWRSGNGVNWTRVVSQGFGDSNNGEVYRFAVFNNTLYASTWSYTTTRGLEIWRSSTGNSGDWTRVISNGFSGNVGNLGATAMEVFNSYLYAGTYNWNSNTITTTGGEVWRTSDGSAWQQVNTSGFGTVRNGAITALAVFDGYLYAGTYNQVWRCQVCDNSDWVMVVNKSYGGMNALEVFDNHLYFVIANPVTGMEVWRTASGTSWEQVGSAGFGDSNNTRTYWDNAVTTFNNRLYIGTGNGANGGEIWKKTVTADFTANHTLGQPALDVTFTNASAGDYTTSLWDFGDGVTSTLTSPTHTFSAIGTYTVTLTVGDGVDTNSLARASYIRVARLVFLPLVRR